MLDHQHKIERRQQWWSGVAMCLPVVSSSILTVVMLLTGHGWGATVAPAAAGASAGVVLGRDQVKRRRGKSDPAAVPLAPQAAAT
jgi:glycine/D-amino acid oxidase-like deaminating enzyme